MNGENIKGDTLTHWVCMTLFVVFAFVYLYCYQADLLTVMQHILSKGQTHYNHLIGAIIITLVSLLLQVGVSNLCKRTSLAESLTYVPSILCITALTSARLSASGDMVFGGWVVGLPLALVCFGLAVWGAYVSGLLSTVASLVRCQCHSLWMNMLAMAVMMLFVCGFSNSDKVFHARIHAEQCLANDDLDGALEALNGYGQCDDNIVMLTSYALSRKGELANRLFEYRLKGGADALLPDGRERRLLMYPEKNLYLYLGGWYTQRMSAMHYLGYQQRHHLLNDKAVDYLLCGYLLDRNLDAFAQNVGRYYEINDSLPKHYKEALILYQHKRYSPQVTYNNNVMSADFQDFQKLEQQYGDKRERQTKLRDTYGNTYWYYYQYKD